MEKNEAVPGREEDENQAPVLVDIFPRPEVTSYGFYPSTTIWMTLKVIPGNNVVQKGLYIYVLILYCIRINATVGKIQTHISEKSLFW